ncbi:MAG: lasso RiPP family leader peptide-containing protein [Phycisphaerae bacterium]|nr:lasso RiPP family leader peptide-containing protein [Phycisphaerae bacterium]
MQEQEQQLTKKRYEKPEIVQHGTVEELTNQVVGGASVPVVIIMTNT